MNTKIPKISVITVVYNAEDYIEETIKSVLAQTFQDFEYILVDDRSTDRTTEIISLYAKRDSRIKLFKNQENLGIAGNRNRGVELAKGEYIAWQDADDISYSYRLKKQVEFMEKNIQVGICGGSLQFFDENGNKGVRKYAQDDASLRKNIFRFSPVAQPAAMIRTVCIREAGKYDLRWPPAEDLDMSFRIGSKYKFANLPERMIKYREHGNSATYKKLKVMELNTIAIRREYSVGYGYAMSPLDKLYNIMQYLSIFIVPAKTKIWLFNKIRNC